MSEANTNRSGTWPSYFVAASPLRPYALIGNVHSYADERAFSDSRRRIVRQSFTMGRMQHSIQHALRLDFKRALNRRPKNSSKINTQALSVARRRSSTTIRAEGRLCDARRLQMTAHQCADRPVRFARVGNAFERRRRRAQRCKMASVHFDERVVMPGHVDDPRHRQVSSDNRLYDLQAMRRLTMNNVYCLVDELDALGVARSRLAATHVVGLQQRHRRRLDHIRHARLQVQQESPRLMRLEGELSIYV